MPNGGDTLSAHIALPSLCFSNPIVSTRSWMPAITCWAATIAVEPPTLPAVWTRNTGLPDAASASASHSSGITTPSSMSGALPMTIASMSSIDVWASASARSTASRTSPAIDTSARARGVLRLTDPEHRTAFRHHSPSMTADEVLLQARPAGAVGERPVGRRRR